MKTQGFNVGKPLFHEWTTYADGMGREIFVNYGDEEPTQGARVDLMLTNSPDRINEEKITTNPVNPAEAFHTLGELEEIFHTAGRKE